VMMCLRNRQFWHQNTTESSNDSISEFNFNTFLTLDYDQNSVIVKYIRSSNPKILGSIPGLNVFFFFKRLSRQSNFV
jgi:hypothetical protein